MLTNKIVIFILLVFSIANGNDNLIIYQDYNKSIEIAKKENKPIFILFTKENCQWCKKLESEILTNNQILQRLKDEYIILFLNKNQDEYPQKIYDIQAVPTVFLISPTQEIYTQIVGYHSKPKDYLKWFNYVKIEREEP
jgi:thioredoxin-related protein